MKKFIFKVLKPLIKKELLKYLSSDLVESQIKMYLKSIEITDKIDDEEKSRYVDKIVPAHLQLLKDIIEDI